MQREADCGDVQGPGCSLRGQRDMPAKHPCACEPLPCKNGLRCTCNFLSRCGVSGLACPQKGLPHLPWVPMTGCCEALHTLRTGSAGAGQPFSSSGVLPPT